MIKISQEKIVRSTVGSARLEGYKGSPKAPTTEKAAPACPKAMPKIKDKR